MNAFYSCGCSIDCNDDLDCHSKPCPTCSQAISTCIGEQCDEIYDCKCIIYNGPDLACYGVYNGDNLCKILEIAAYGLVPGCAPTTTTTIPPTTTTSTVPSVVSRCVADRTYFGIEQPRGKNGAWIQFPFTFKLLKMELDGVDYLNGTNPILSINSSSDPNFTIGIGLDGNTYVMSISDWLNTIAVGSGFVFHDNMRVIDYPYVGATLFIEVEETYAIEGGIAHDIYNYTNDGFGLLGTNNTYTCNPFIK